jgi:hypothetical protein
MANKVYRAVESAIVFQETGGNEPLTFNGLDHGAGHVSDRYDRGAGSLPVLHKWRAVVCWGTAGVVGEYLEIYLVESDGTHSDGMLGVADADWTDANIKPNLQLIGIVKCQTTGDDTENCASGFCMIHDRYFSVAIWNVSTATLLAAHDNLSSISFIPMPDEIQ